MSESPRAAGQQRAQKAAARAQHDGEQNLVADAEQVVTSLDASLISALTFFVGLWLGHRLQLGRDRIREFNAAVTPVRAYLLCQIDNPRWGNVRAPTLIELDAFEHSLGWLRREGFRRAWQHQEQVSKSDVGITYDPRTGDVAAANFTLLLAALRDCLRYTKRR